MKLKEYLSIYRDLNQICFLVGHLSEQEQDEIMKNFSKKDINLLKKFLKQLRVSIKEQLK